jgi:NADP-dependent 3-hydroxy acid dehydrogenase YdfG
MSAALQGRVAIVTGASSGIGRATALLLAEAGAAVVAHARRGEKLAEVVREITEKGGKSLAVAGDAAKEKDVIVLVDRAKAYAGEVGGRLDIVVVNAGRGLAGGLLSSDEKQWREMYEVNVMGAAMLMRRVGAMMAEQGRGDIVVLGSAAGYNISPFSGFYGSSKFAVAAMAEAFRREVCGKGVRVMIVKPGLVLSEFQGVAGYTYENFYKNAERFGKLLEPADVAEAIRFGVMLPEHVAMNEIVIRPTRQDYP